MSLRSVYTVKVVSRRYGMYHIGMTNQVSRRGEPRGMIRVASSIIRTVFAFVVVVVDDVMLHHLSRLFFWRQFCYLIRIHRGSTVPW